MPQALTWLYVPQKAVHVAACIVSLGGVVLCALVLRCIHEQASSDRLEHLHSNTHDNAGHQCLCDHQIGDRTN
jgi:hypothetical protein